ncbi:SCP2 sterol-binding domain-containing protein [Mycena albidolilacea]|uniref:SCP2 sterol-binding domain-containing protein n=1 Tax=Mycena albidolilacea TaxID=1033008 RepID=A0AAD7F174_9AGAR|nr:SCP2 sterol-binding domain-containing protein [Mycena albidolilacea]
MSDDLKVEGFQASELIAGIAAAFASLSDVDKAAQLKKTNGIFQLQVKNAEGKEENWTIDLKKTGTVYKGPAKPKADVTIILSDETLMDLASGKLNGQKAFMTGKLKTKGNMMLATKLGDVLNAAKPKAKL